MPGYWQLDILWSVLASADRTGGAFSILEQLMPRAAGPPPHVHAQGAEVFYILDGELALQLREQVVTGTRGQLVRIPPGTPHAFAVTSETARVLNFYVPATLDHYLAATSVTATAPTLPPPQAQSPPTEEQTAAFQSRLVELATQRWLDSTDLLAHLRTDSGAEH